jgi:hypothetical protein
MKRLSCRIVHFDRADANRVFPRAATTCIAKFLFAGFPKPGNPFFVVLLEIEPGFATSLNPDGDAETTVQCGM